MENLQNNITTNLTTVEPGVSPLNIEIYAYTLQSNITTDVKKKKGGGPSARAGLYSFNSSRLVKIEIRNNDA
jgi:hypothetical protein